MSDTVPVSVIIPTYKNGQQLLDTLRRIRQCRPAPNEILVYIDNSDRATQGLLKQDMPDIHAIMSSEHLGPGGGRNLLIDVATNDVVASFDDDSYPLDPDYFARAAALLDRFEEAAVLAARITHKGEQAQESEETYEWTADFVGCGAVYRREAFIETGGYVALPIAYGMEETDLSLRLLARNWHVLSCRSLRVFHDTDRQNQKRASIVAGSIANIALLTYLRYPSTRFWLGALQVLRRMGWCWRHSRRLGILLSLWRMPVLIWKFRSDRAPVSEEVIEQYLDLRHHPVRADPQ